jgi:UDP-glucuronate 4-epimerase
MPHAMVTGAAGFIGSHVCEALLAGGWRVTGLDSFDEFYSPRVKRRNVLECEASNKFSVVEGDIRDRQVVEAALENGVDAIIHLAARAGVRPSIEQPLLYQDVNVGGTCVLLEAARRHRIRRFIFASSSSVYGNAPKTPFSESDNVDFPISPYAATKKAGELLCYTYHHLFGINVTCLRFFTVYGPRQRPDLAIHKFARLIESDQPVPMFGDGGMTRDYTYVADTVAGVLAAVEKCRGYHIYNLGNSNPISLRDLIGAIGGALGKTPRIQRLPAQPGDVERTFADIGLAARELGYRPRTDFRTGLGRFVEWLRRQPAEEPVLVE